MRQFNFSSSALGSGSTTLLKFKTKMNINHLKTLPTGTFLNSRHFPSRLETVILPGSYPHGNKRLYPGSTFSKAPGLRGCSAPPVTNKTVPLRRGNWGWGCSSSQTSPPAWCAPAFCPRLCPPVPPPYRSSLSAASPFSSLSLKNVPNKLQYGYICNIFDTNIFLRPRRSSSASTGKKIYRKTHTV